MMRKAIYIVALTMPLIKYPGLFAVKGSFFINKHCIKSDSVDDITYLVMFTKKGKIIAILKHYTLPAT